MRPEGIFFWMMDQEVFAGHDWLIGKCVMKLQRDQNVFSKWTMWCRA
jgi:hypothetical protein